MQSAGIRWWGRRGRAGAGCHHRRDPGRGTRVLRSGWASPGWWTYMRSLRLDPVTLADSVVARPRAAVPAGRIFPGPLRVPRRHSRNQAGPDAAGPDAHSSRWPSLTMAPHPGQTRFANKRARRLRRLPMPLVLRPWPAAAARQDLP